MDQDRTPIQRRKLSDEVRERLLAEIEGGNLSPGQVLPSERELMSSYGVGRPAVREAMQALQGMGLVIVRHGERPRVAEPQLDRLYDQLALTMHHVLTHGDGMLDQLKEARAILEIQMVGIAAQRGTPAQLAGLRAILDQQVAATSDIARFTELDGAFHYAIALISGNALIASVTQAIFSWMARFHAHLVQTPGLERVALSEHEAIFEALVRKDADIAAKAMRDHLERASVLYSQDNLSP